MPSVNLSRERSLYKSFTDHALQARQKDMARLQEQLTTGLRVNRPSDDPSSFGQARHLEALAQRYNQFQRSVAAARTWVDQTQQALGDLAELYTQSYEEGLRISNGIFSDGDREAAAKRLEGLLDTIVDRLNARSGDEYLFAGSRTTVKPFDNGGAVVAYQGNDGGRTRHIGRELSINVNIDGARLNNTGAGFTITESLENLIDAVRSGVPANMETALGQVTTSRDHVIDLGGEAGSIGTRLHIAETQLVDAALLVEGRRSKLEDADFAEAMMDLQKTQTGLQASLMVAASVLQTSILDYLR
jgi:flagellar hook-associated protein 3 FlgL